jgi:hypothetical protein
VTDLPTLEDLADPQAPPLPPPDSAAGLRRAWLTDGFVVVKGMVPATLVEPYVRVRERAGGWERSATPYMSIPELRDLCCWGVLAKALEEVLGEPAGVHLNLAGWVSTERNWHADRYLNPPHVRDVYAAVWFALDRIHPDSGPFEWVVGSHRWPPLDGDRVVAELMKRRLTDVARVRTGAWPWDSEKLLTPVVEREIAARGARTKHFLGGKGDVLIWHPRLWHRGSPPKVKGMERRALIAHYSGINHRVDMPAAAGHGGGYYFPLARLLPPEEAGGRVVPTAWPQSSLALKYGARPRPRGLNSGASAHNRLAPHAPNVAPGDDADFYESEQRRLFNQANTTIDLVGEANSLPFADSSLDFVASSHVLEHSPDLLGALKEIHRVLLKPGGINYVVHPHPDALEGDRGPAADDARPPG